MRRVCIALAFLALSLAIIPIDYCMASASNAWANSNPTHESAFSTDPASAVHLKLLLDSSSKTSIQEQVRRLSLLGHVGTVIGDVVTLDVPSTIVPDLSGLEFVQRVETSRRMRPLLDVSVPEIGAPDVWQNLKDDYGRDVNGSGSLVGVVDTGIDWSHPDFFFENGTSKIAFIWDQSGSGNPPVGFNYGTECIRADIEARICQELDEDGHGTHVAGIAASTGLASGKYYGVAPGASILFVKARPSYDFKNRWSTDDAAMIDGVNYLWQKAQVLGQPIVINLSLGGNIGPHDDTSLLEKALDEFAARGAIIVVSAGNDGDGKIHAAGTLAATNSVSVNWSVDDEEQEVAVDVWYSLTDDFAISVKTPSGETIEGPTSNEGITARDAKIKILSNSTEKGKEWFISATSDAYLKPSKWGFTLTGVQASDGKWDAWISSGEFRSGHGYDVTVSSTVGDPATASGVITVGAYATKLQWTDSKGDVSRFTAEQKLNDIASFSSLGPTRDGRTKPDIVAPGLGIASARSANLEPDPTDPDRFHTVMAGTSMAAPHITGLVALILQFNPYLTVNQVKQILRTGARTDRFTHAIDPDKGSNTWGWGKASAKTSVPESINLFAITIAMEDLPASASVDLRLDGASVTSLRGNETVTFELNTGTHTIEVNEIAPYSGEIRYRAIDNSISFSKGGRRTFQYVTQYYLRVESERGPTKGSGWYDAGMHAVFSVEDHVPGPTGVDYLLIPWRVTFTFDHWTGDISSPTPSGSVEMDGPKTVTATWRSQKDSDYTFLIVFVLIAAAASVVVVIVLMRRSRGQVKAGACVGPVTPPPVPPTPVVAPTPVPAVPLTSPRRAIALAPGTKFCIHCGQPIPHTARFCTNIKCGMPQQ